MEGIVASMVGGSYRVFTDSDVVEASLRGRLKQSGNRQIVVGDTVTLERQPDGAVTIESRLERRSELRRRTPGRSRGTRMVAANVDRIFVVGSAKQPDWDDHLIDRFLAVAEVNHIPPVIVITKADLDPNASALGAIYEKIGYEVLVTSIPQNQSVDDVRARAVGLVSLFTGSTGVGKSSLLNAIEPGLALRTGAVSKKAGMGRHTTVAAEMFNLTGGGFVVDTPGLRDVGLWALEPAEVVAAFPEILRLAVACRFDDCRHLREPDCAVIEASERGEVAASRLRSYRRFLEEAQIAGRR